MNSPVGGVGGGADVIRKYSVDCTHPTTTQVFDATTSKMVSIPSNYFDCPIPTPDDFILSLTAKRYDACAAHLSEIKKQEVYNEAITNITKTKLLKNVDLIVKYEELEKICNTK